MLISLIGTWMQSVGEAWLVLKLTNDPVALGIVAACAFGPVLILGLFGGIVADSVSKRKALYVTQVVAGLLALTTGIARRDWRRPGLDDLRHRLAARREQLVRHAHPPVVRRRDGRP